MALLGTMLAPAPPVHLIGVTLGGEDGWAVEAGETVVEGVVVQQFPSSSTSSTASPASAPRQVVFMRCRLVAQAVREEVVRAAEGDGDDGQWALRAAFWGRDRARPAANLRAERVVVGGEGEEDGNGGVVVYRLVARRRIEWGDALVLA